MNPVFQRLWLVGALVAGTAHGADGAVSSQQATCTISISGVEVDLGRTTLAQCTSYARSSLLDKAEVKSRVVRHGDTWLRISASAVESSPDAGKSWLPAQEDTRPTLGGLATMGRTVPAVDSVVAAPRPADVPPRAPPPEPVVQQPKNQEKPKSVATIPAPAPATVTSVAEPLVAQPSLAVKAASVATAPVSTAITQQETCDYKQDGRWRSLAAGSLTECVEKIRSKFQSIPDLMAEGYWGGTFIALASARVYVSSDGKDWSELTR